MILQISRFKHRAISSTLEKLAESSLLTPKSIPDGIVCSDIQMGTTFESKQERESNSLSIPFSRAKTPIGKTEITFAGHFFMTYMLILSTLSSSL